MDASLIGSMIAGGVVLPIVAGVTALAAALMRQWRVVGFLVFTKLERRFAEELWARTSR